MPQPFKLIALDIDGTLLNRNKDVSEENKYWIDRAREAGIEVTLSTGRHRNGIVRDFSQMLQIQVPMVTLNGGEVWSPEGELLARHPLSDDDILFLYGLAKEVGARCWGSTIEGPYPEASFPNPLTGATWLKFGYNSDCLDIIESLWQRLRHHRGFELTNSDPLNIEVNPKGVHKASGLAVVCEKLHIDASEVVAMGDSLNDVEMLKWAGLGIAMGNAQDHVKRVANRVTDTCDNHGVAKAIQSILQNQ